jgi:hypothetical protein
MRPVATAVLAAALVLTLPGCVRTGDHRPGNVGRYCERLVALEAQSARPAAGDLDELIRVAPREIRDSVRSLVEAGGTPFDDTPAARELLARSRDICRPAEPPAP